MTEVEFTDMAKACMDGDLDKVKEILEGDFDINSSLKWKDNDGEILNSPPIFIAIDFNHGDIVHALIDGGTDIDIYDDNKYTPLHWACWNGRLEIVKMLIQKGATVDQEGLDLAKEYGHKEVQSIMFENIDLYKDLEGDQDEIIIKASREGDIKMVKKMLDEGYDLDKWKDENGNYQKYSPISIAYKCGHIDIIQEYIKAGVELEWNAADNE